MSLLSTCATCSVSSERVGQLGHRLHQRLDAELRRLVGQIALALGRHAGDRPAGAEDHNNALHFCPIWIKIQPLDASTGTAVEESPKLTARQQQILDLVQSTIERSGAPPTRAEIAAELGFRSPNAAEEHLQALARKGVIELVGGTSRGIRLRPETLRALNQTRGKQFSLPLPSLAQLALPLVGRVAAGSPILAQEHIDQTYLVEASMFPRRPTTCSRCAA